MYMARTMSCCDKLLLKKNTYYNWIYGRKIKVHHCKRDGSDKNECEKKQTSVQW